MAKSDASVKTARGASGFGCAISVAYDRASLHSLNAFVAAGLQLTGVRPWTLPKRPVQGRLGRGSPGQESMVEVNHGQELPEALHRLWLLEVSDCFDLIG